MNRMPGKQKGGALLTIVVLALIGYGIYVAIQYVPLRIESDSVDSILESIETSYQTEPVGSKSEISAKISNLLNVNQMDDLKKNFQVKQNLDRTVIEVKFERELNLIYEKKVLKYQNSITLGPAAM